MLPRSSARLAVPVGAACVAVLAAGLPSSVASPAGDGGRAAPDASTGDSTTPAAFARRGGAATLRNLSVENVADFVAIRSQHAGAYWDGRTDVKIGVDGDKTYPYRVSVDKGDGAAEVSRAGGAKWKCSGVHASAADEGSETLVVVPRSCFDSGADKVRAKATTHPEGGPTSSAAAGYVSRTEKPNVVVIMSDDMRDDEYGGPWMNQTRRWIGDAGVRFENSFAPLPLCAPARASFLTGQYPHNHGVWSVKPPYGFSAFRDKDTLPVWLQQGGYRTFMLGKYINGYGKGDMPAPGGGSSVRYIPPGWDDWRASIDSKGTYNYRGTHLNNNGRIQSLAGTYQTNAYKQIASAEVRKRARSDHPYFMYLSFTAPHHGAPGEDDDPKEVTDLEGHDYRIKTPARPEPVRGLWDDDIPLAPGAGGESDMTDKPKFMQRLPGMSQSERDGVRNLARQRAESLGLLDRAVGRVVRRLKAAQELDNTYVIFTSDNGYFLGEHRMRQGKTLPYEPSLRTPTLVRGPGIPASETRQDPFLSTDFAPTILRMAGLSTDRSPPIDGQSMLDVAQGGDRGWSRAIVTETGPATVPTLMDLDGNTFGKDPNEGSRSSRMHGIRAPGFLFTETSRREPELYDLRSDPGEVDSVVDDSRFNQIRDDLNALLERLHACLGAECRVPLPSSLNDNPDDDASPPKNESDDSGDHHGGANGKPKDKDDGKPKDKDDGKPKSNGDDKPDGDR
ncbi:sulfatase family protein [Solicola gregarius]|uniref:Sulfatase n=1 Tax=Solicola gregarius TaxID=2908642 RepID=A0AA46TGH1_9ACTN|nr:sulfatase [Solicola gregarius]UYM04367.1 sulfatase [Solicola gregarius]